MPRYTINEPHPTVAKDAFIHAGRGGAGNHFRAPVTTPASGVTSTVKPMPPTSARFYSGRGGAGNAHAKAERPIISFDEEYARQSAREQKLRGHVGRGGAGNAYSKATVDSVPVRKGSDASSHRSSTSSSSVRSGFFARLSLGSKH
ncbi:uncharacterized protein B0I36DRAFT_351772 [Microdochium trichocladiopsis]|uniref:Uncharacterized protein n=1 Tax=Microdochium trichocladiopsis TaxID=1682393 RepID=A0A9P9BQF2_9PEZI|nr:uncharacterized protein B0I36DRAFT_351772 [Microdochium trichocladiopsis]KAH7025812.1 hypothetical protein B0I36DRAFT_351772 [Microdochium trichocladiopsis]